MPQPLFKLTPALRVLHLAARKGTPTVAGDAESLARTSRLGGFSSLITKPSIGVNGEGFPGGIKTRGYSDGGDGEVSDAEEGTSCERVESRSWTDLQRALCLIPDSGNPPHHVQHGVLQDKRDSSRPPPGGREPISVVSPTANDRADGEGKGRVAFVPDGVSVEQDPGEEMKENKDLRVQVLSPRFGQIFSEGTTNKTVFLARCTGYRCEGNV